MDYWLLLVVGLVGLVVVVWVVFIGFGFDVVVIFFYDMLEMVFWGSVFWDVIDFGFVVQCEGVEKVYLKSFIDIVRNGYWFKGVDKFVNEVFLFVKSLIVDWLSEMSMDIEVFLSFVEGRLVFVVLGGNNVWLGEWLFFDSQF